MRVTNEGHVCVSPAEVCSSLADAQRLINDALIPGTPLAFQRYSGYREFVAAGADAFGIHPQNFLLRGSSKIGFSINDEPARAWIELRPESDLDLAIIDTDYYHYLDREIRHWERSPTGRNAIRSGRERSQAVDRRKHRQYYTYRYFDLPRIQCVVDHDSRLKELPVEDCCGVPRSIDAFVFRDWWSVYGKWESDLRSIRKAINDGKIERGGDEPRTLQQ